jgi:twitching motility protein PilT
MSTPVSPAPKSTAVTAQAPKPGAAPAPRPAAAPVQKPAGSAITATPPVPKPAPTAPPAQSSSASAAAGVVGGGGVAQSSVPTDLLKIPEDAPPTDPKRIALLKSEPEVQKIFRMCMKLQASDIHLKVGQPPMFRLRGDIRRTELKPVTQEDMERMFHPIMTPKQRKILDDEGGVDFSWVVGEDECRFRVSLFKQRGKLSLVSRRVNNAIPKFADLGLPPVIEKLCKFPEGLVILAGVTGSGKSTTIASMLDYVNETEPLHILTCEDPIEFVFTDKMSYMNQREIGLDSKDWHKALKDAVRQDPDVILIGELRDVETFEAAVHAAETGHLVFGTIHASSSSTTINRIMDLFPPDKHPAIRQALANNLKAVVAQKLVKGIKKGRVPTNEIMIVNSMIKKLIAEGEDKKIPDAIRIGVQEGMQDFNTNLNNLVMAGDIEKSTALEFSPNPDQLKMLLKGIKVAAPGIL